MPQQQLVEIASRSANAKVLIFDEPTASRRRKIRRISSRYCGFEDRVGNDIHFAPPEELPVIADRDCFATGEL
jgi:hypothetical protein